MRSLVAVTYDVLAFIKSGNFGRFDRAFSKACKYLNVELPDQLRAKLRNITFHHLRSSGYIDVSYSGASTHWSASGSVAVALESGDYGIIGTSQALRQIATMLGEPSKTISEQEFPSGLPEGVRLYPEIPVFQVEGAAMSRACADLGIPVIRSLQLTMFEKLPDVAKVGAHCLVREQDVVFLSESASFRLNYSTQDWEQSSDTRISEPGLYKREYPYAPPDYFIACRNWRDTVEVYRVLEREWYAIAALWKLKLQVPLKYNSANATVVIPKSAHGFRLPTLIERALRAGALCGPTSAGDSRQFSGVLPGSVWALSAKFPVFKVEIE